MHWITRNIDWYSAFSINLGLFFPYFYLQLFSIDQGISSGLAFYSITLLNAGSVLGRIFPNFFADRCGTYNILLPCLFISSALAFSMFAITNFTGMAVFGVLYGFWSGSCKCFFNPFSVSPAKFTRWRTRDANGNRFLYCWDISACRDST